MAGELSRCREGLEGRLSCDAWSCDSSVPAEEGLDSLDTILLIVASEGLRGGAIFSLEGARRSSVLGGAVGVTARLLAAEFADRLVVGVMDRAVDRVADRAAAAASENVAARVIPTGGVFVWLEGGVLAFVAGGVTGLLGAANVWARVKAVGVADRRLVDDGTPWVVGVGGRRSGSLVPAEGFTPVVGPARLVAELLEYAASPVDRLSSSFGFPGIEMLADLPLVWTDGLVTVVDGGYLVVVDAAAFSFRAITSLVASVMDLVRRPGMPGAAGALEAAAALMLLLLLLVAVFFRLVVELLELDATEGARAPCLRLGRRVGDTVRGIDGSRVLDDRVGMPVAGRIERERGIDDDMVAMASRLGGIVEDSSKARRVTLGCWHQCPTDLGDVREL